MRIIDVLETIFPQNGETKVTGSPCIFIVVLLSTIFRFVRRRGNLTNERKKVRVYLYGLVNWKRGGGREGGSVWEKSYMVYWILFPGFGLDRRFDRCEEREGRLYFHLYYRYVAESSVYELRYRSFSKNPRFALASVCKILTSRSNVRSRTYDIATYGLLWLGERERMRARTLYTTHGNFITERALHVVLPETNERKYFRFAQHLNNFFF